MPFNRALLTICLACLLVNSSFSQADFCVNAVEIFPTMTICSPIPGSSAGATQSYPTCSGGGVADDDVWYFFVANSTQMTIDVDPTVSYDAVIELYSACGIGNNISCQDVNGNNGDETLVASGLMIGATYYFRVYHYGVGSGSSTFNVCVTGLAPTTNNTPCSAYALPTVTPACQFQTYTNLGSAGSAVPTPSACGGSSPFQGGYAGGDVWFSVVVPASGTLDIHTLSLDFSDGAMALYSGPCAAPTLVECDDDDGPGLMPYIYQTGLTPGSTYYIRMWEYGNNSNGQFGICVSTPDNDDCANALEICDLNGYGGITSAAYLIDRPDNMAGMGEIPPGPFGTGYTGGSPVTIDNNHWLKFTATGTTAELFVNIHACALNLGMQMQIFEATNCTNFVPVSNFLETTTSQTVLATGLTPGQVYYIMVDGFAGDVCSYTITATSGIQVVEVVAVPAQVCLGDSTTITATVTGTGSFTYTWSSTPVGGPFPSGPTFTEAPTVNTEYTVDITGLCGSGVTASVTVIVNDNPTTSISPTPVEFCEGGSFPLVGNNAGGSGIFTNGVWDSNITLSGQAINSATISSNTAGNYWVSYEVTDNNGCTAKDSIDVLVNPLPDATITPVQPMCNDASPVTLSAATGGGSFSGPGVSGNTFNPVGLNPGTHTITYNVTDGNGCSNSATLDIVVNPLPDASFPPIGPFCDGDLAVVLIPATSGGTWTGPGTGGGNFDPTVAGPGSHNIGYSVTDGNGCSASSSQTVVVNALPDATITPVAPLCNDAAPATLAAATGGGSFSGPGVTGSTFDPSGLTPGTYTVTYNVTDGNGCSASSTLDIVVNPLPDATITPIGPFCTGDPIEPLVAATPGGTWSGNGVTGSNFDPSAVTNGTYTVSYNITDANGCSNSDNISVVVSNALDATIGPAGPYCSDGMADTLTAGNLGGTWSGPGITDPNNGIFDPALAGPGTYTVVYSIPGSCGDIDSASITVNPAQDASITAAGPFCPDDAAVNLVPVETGGTWSGNGITDMNAGTFDPASAGAGTHTITYALAGACPTSETIDIVVNPTPASPTAVGSTVCEGDSILYTANGSGGTLNWYDDAGLTNQVASNSSTFSSTSAGPFYVVEVVLGCASASTAVNGMIHSIDASFTATPDIGPAPLDVDFTNTSTDVSPTDSFHWDFGDGNFSNAFEPSHTYTQEGTYEVILTITTADGLCSDTYTWTIVVEDDFWVEIPNVFTPNNDGMNDKFNISYRGVESVEIEIFNRWGQHLFTWYSLEDGWDGRTTAGELAPDGTYYYIIVVTDREGELHEFTGPFTLIR